MARQKSVGYATDFLKNFTHKDMQQENFDNLVPHEFASLGFSKYEW